MNDLPGYHRVLAMYVKMDDLLWIAAFPNEPVRVLIVSGQGETHIDITVQYDLDKPHGERRKTTHRYEADEELWVKDKP